VCVCACVRVCVCTGIKDEVMRELDSKLVVIDLVTVHRVHVHVGRLLRVLQGVMRDRSLFLCPPPFALPPSVRPSVSLCLSLSPSLSISLSLLSNVL